MNCSMLSIGLKSYRFIVLQVAERWLVSEVEPSRSAGLQAAFAEASYWIRGIVLSEIVPAAGDCFGVAD